MSGERLDLAGIRARAEAANRHAGHWSVDQWLPKDRDYETQAQVYRGAGGPGYAFVASDVFIDDAEHIAGMDPATTLALVAEVEQLREEARLREKSLHACRKVDAELDEARTVLGAVAALADDLDREAKMLGGQHERTRSHIANRLRAVLAPVSGAVEAVCVCAGMCGSHEAECGSCEYCNPFTPTPVAVHEQEVREDVRHTEVRITCRYGVNERQASIRVYSGVEGAVDNLRRQIERETMGPVEVTKVETRAVATGPWTLAARTPRATS